MSSAARYVVIALTAIALSSRVFGQEASPEASPTPEATPSESSQENLDDLFNSSSGDSVATDTAIDHRSQYEKREGIQFTGEFKVTGGIAAGWTAMPAFQDLSRNFDPNIGMTASTTLFIDARPDSIFRAFGSLTSSVDPSNGGPYTWTSFSIGELFCDYTLLDAVFIRAGKFGNTWGQGRLFNPGNVISDIGSFFALRASLPSLLQGVSAMAGVDPDHAPSGTSQGMSRSLIGAARADMVFGGLLIGIGARCQYYDGVDGFLSLKKVLFGTDFLADALATYANGNLSYKALVGFFREWNELKLNVEYCYDSSSSYPRDHRIGAEIGFKKIFGSGFDVGARCFHAFSDNSGSDVIAASFSPWSRVTIVIALPFAYGPDGGIFVASGVNEEMAGYRVGLGIRAELKGKY